MIFLGLMGFLLAGQGCHWGRKEAAPPPPEAVAAPLEPSGPAEAAASAGVPSGVPGEPPAAAGIEATPSPSSGAPDIGAAPVPPAEAPEAAEPAGTPPLAGEERPEAVPEAAEPLPGTAAEAGPPGPIPENGAKRPGQPPAHAEEPAWARSREELDYRVEFLGVTMGYARFSFKGKALLNGKETYRLSVRAWTSGVLSVLYPVNETIDYYLDVKTLAPLRQESTKRERAKDDVAVYDQETGRIVYRYRHNGEIRKKVDAAPNVYDPVTVAYYFRARDLGWEDRPRNVYAGRKLWQISCRNLGVERLATARGEVETVVIQPVIKRDGKLENKGDLRMWMTNDARHVPVRIYAKFKKIRMWTLVGELMPRQEGG